MAVSADDRSTPEALGDPDLPPAGGWSVPTRVLAAAAVLVVALGAAAVVATVVHPARLGVAFSRGGPTTGAPATGGGAGEPAADRTGAGGAAAEPGTAEPGGAGRDPTRTAPREGRRSAELELVDALTTLEVRTTDLGDDLYRISAPAGGVSPRPQLLGDRVRLPVERTDRPGVAVVRVLLNERVTWRLRLAAAVTEQRLDLATARLAGVELVGGSTRTELRLPRPPGTLTVRVSGGVTQLSVHAPGPVRVWVADGAGSVSVPGVRREAVPPDTLISSPDWDRSAGGLRLDLVAPANTVTVAESGA